MEIKTEVDYQAALLKVKQLIVVAPQETAAIAALAEAVDDYEIKAGHGPMRPDTLIGRLEIEMVNRQLNRKQMAELLGIPASRFSDLLNGKTAVSLAVAKRLYKKLGIPAEFILETA